MRKKADFESLEASLPSETEEQKELAKPILEKMKRPYKDKIRNRIDGPMNLGSSLELREDFFAYSFLFKFKRGYIFEDGEVSEDDKEEENKVAEANPA